MKLHQIQKKWEVSLRTQDELINQLLVNRSVALGDKEIFLNPNFERNFLDPYLLTNIKKVVVRISKAMDAKETIGVFSDYDCDGVTSAKLLKNLFDQLGLKTYYYFPSRKSGYGLNSEGLDYLKNSGASLIIASDLGITGKKEVEYAKKNKLELIIFDHHLIQKKHLPSCLIINPKQEGDKYPFKHLSAGGVVFKFLWAMHMTFPDKITENFCKWNIDLAAISTIADIMPLQGENRLIVKYGLITLAKTKNIGLKELIKVAAINTDKLTPGVIGFQIAPRLNAPGRVTHANLSFELLNANLNNSFPLANEINKLNDTRRQEMENIMVEAKAKITQEKKNKAKVIVISSKNWTPGLVGLVAGKLMEEFSRPIIVLSTEENISRGSARSIEPFHLLEAFEHIGKYLISFGGHARAGGLSLENKHLDTIYDLLNIYAENKLKDNDLIPKVAVDCEISREEINLKTYDTIMKLAPFGFGNPKPVFLLRTQKIQNLKKLGKDNQHLKIKFDDLEAILFNDNNKNIYKVGEAVDVVFTLEKNEWNGNSKIELNIIDWKLSGK